MGSERIKDYFVEDIQNNARTEQWRLITQAAYQDSGLVVEASKESFTFLEASKLIELFHRYNVRAPLWDVQYKTAQ